jgi:circadian clock protein KaiC
MGDDEARRVARLPTGVPGLDAVLQGGLQRGAMYVLSGCPGSGKTVLAAHLAFAAARAGESVLHVTLVAESQARLLASIGSFDFFDGRLVGDRIRFESAAAALDDRDPLERVHALLCGEVHEKRATVLVVDSIGGLAECARSAMAYRRFLRHLAAACSMAGATVILITTEEPHATGLDQQIADGVIELFQPEQGMRRWRELAVAKHRGSDALPGRHPFEIDRRGIVVHPRREALPVRPVPAHDRLAGKCAFGIAGLDAMLEGGVPVGSVTALIGAPGSGKTLLGLHLLAEGLKRGEPAVYFGLFETPSRLLAKAAGVGLALAPYVDDGSLRIVWRPPTEQGLDGLAEELLETTLAVGAARVFVDGVDGLLQAAARPERFPAWFAALTNELRAGGATSAVTVETDLGGTSYSAAPTSVSATVENIVLSRYVEVRSQLHRLLSIAKVRESGYDPSVREFRIGADGVTVAASFASAEAVLGDLAAGSVPAEASARAPSGPRDDG